MDIAPVLVICLVIIGLNSLQIKRLARKDYAVTSPSFTEGPRFMKLYAVLLVLLLVTPLGFRAYTERKVEHRISDAITVSLPARYKKMIKSDGKIVFHDLTSDDVYNPSIVLHIKRDDYSSRVGILDMAMNQTENNIDMMEDPLEDWTDDERAAKDRHRITRKVDTEKGQMYVTVHTVLPGQYLQNYLNGITREIEAGIR
jgi:hypothetical protein